MPYKYNSIIILSNAVEIFKTSFRHPISSKSYGRVLKRCLFTRGMVKQHTKCHKETHRHTHRGRVKFENVGIAGMPVLWLVMGL